MEYNLKTAATAEKKAKVSVVIPTYGRAEMVVQAVLAALSQELEPYEIIVGDDNSPDDTVFRLNSIACNYSKIKILKSDTNSGGVANWNRVIDAATGEYIAYCSDDDYFLPYHLKGSVKYLEDHHEIDLVHSGFFNLSESPGGLPKVSIELISKNIDIVSGIEALRHIVKNTSYPFQPSTFVFRKKLWDAVGKFNSKYSVADTEWFIRVGLSYRVAYLPVPSVVNRRHLNNWSNRVGSMGMNEEFHNMMRDAIEFIKRDNNPHSYIILKMYWQACELIKFTRIYLARSRAGLFDVSGQSADMLWLIIFNERRGVSYVFFSRIMRFFSRVLSLLQIYILGGIDKYRSLGQDCPK